MKLLHPEIHPLILAFIILEIVLTTALAAYKLARPTDQNLTLDIGLLLLLMVYNTCGGVLPNPQLPGDYVSQQIIVYGSGFLAAAYFPYYVSKGFEITTLKFHAKTGPILCMALHFLIFTVIFIKTQDLKTAERVLLLLPVYGLFLLGKIIHGIYLKYDRSWTSQKAAALISIISICLLPWIGLPIILWFNWPQHFEIAATNSGFLILLAFHLTQAIKHLRAENILLAFNAKSPLESANVHERIIFNSKRYSLTNRETEIVQYLYKGWTYKQIADALFISERTVGKHIQNIFEKMDISNRYELTHKLGA